ncbi:MAG: DEAD/DEAH box helicase, partial [Chitinophagales bacterium]
GKDVVGIAQTGTGKTFAYLLPTLRMWKYSDSPHPQVMIIVPTRELVAQVVEEVKKLSQYMSLHVGGVYGGTNIRTQRAIVYDGLDVIVGTPGRLLDLMLDGVLRAKEVKRLIIDEVDEMLNLGFRAQLKNIIDHLPVKRQNLMFSATITENVEKVINEYTNFYEKIETAPSGAPLENIQQLAYNIPNFNSKVNLLQRLLDDNEEMSKILVFAGTKKLADVLYARMDECYNEKETEIPATESDEPILIEKKVGIIHSSKSQNNRFASVNAFQQGTSRILIATDIIARGLDVSMVTHVVNFDMPAIAEQYIHRIGRTGRAEKKGVAISFVSEKEIDYLQDIESLMNLDIEVKELPTDLPISTELIELEMPKEHIPFNNKKQKNHQKSETGAFHEKKAKNKKTNSKVPYSQILKAKYKKPKTRGAKPPKRQR